MGSTTAVAGMLAPCEATLLLLAPPFLRRPLSQATPLRSLTRSRSPLPVPRRPTPWNACVSARVCVLHRSVLVRVRACSSSCLSSSIPALFSRHPRAERFLFYSSPCGARTIALRLCLSLSLTLHTPPAASNLPSREPLFPTFPSSFLITSYLPTHHVRRPIPSHPFSPSRPLCVVVGFLYFFLAYSTNPRRSCSTVPLQRDIAVAIMTTISLFCARHTRGILRSRSVVVVNHSIFERLQPRSLEVEFVRLGVLA